MYRPVSTLPDVYNALGRIRDSKLAGERGYIIMDGRSEVCTVSHSIDTNTE